RGGKRSLIIARAEGDRPPIRMIEAERRVGLRSVLITGRRRVDGSEARTLPLGRQREVPAEAPARPRLEGVMQQRGVTFANEWIAAVCVVKPDGANRRSPKHFTAVEASRISALGVDPDGERGGDAQAMKH